MTDKFPVAKEQQSLEYLESITKRDFDLELFADQIESSYMISAPMDLKASILKEAARPEVQLEIKTRKLSRKAQLFYYSLKVGTAVAGALFLLSIAPRLGAVNPALQSYRQEMQMQEPARKIRERSRKITGMFEQISNDIFQSGGNIK